MLKEVRGFKKLAREKAAHTKATQSCSEKVAEQGERAWRKSCS